MYTVAIIEDDAAQAASILSMVEASPLAYRLTRIETTVVDEGPFPSGNAMRSTEISALPDILFVDIRLSGDINGIDLVKRLVPEGSSVQVIYISAYLEYAPSVYRTRHTWFLSKPVEQSELDAALERAVSSLDAERIAPLIVHQGSTLIRITPRHILYVESNRRKVLIHEADRVIETYARISDLQERLPETFARSHKSFLVNMAYIAELSSHEVALINGERLPVSQRCRKALVERFTSYVGRSI